MDPAGDAGGPGGRLTFRLRRTAAARFGLALAVAALAGYPLIDGLAQPGWLGLRLVGVAPAPTVLFTLGLLLMAAHPPRHLLILPLLWSLLAGYTGWRLGVPADALLPVLATLALALGWHRRGAGAS